MWWRPRSSRRSARKGGRIVAFEKYGADRATPARTVAQALGAADALFIADDGDSVVAAADALPRRARICATSSCSAPGCGTIRGCSPSPALQGGLYAAPDPSGFRSFAGRYRTRFGGEPVRTATLAYDAVALVAALARTQGAQRFSPEVLTNPSGFAGIDGLFRFRADGTNERGLAVMKVGHRRQHAGRRFAEEFWRLVDSLRGQIRHHGIEHRESRPASPAAGRRRRR